MRVLSPEKLPHKIELEQSQRPSALTERALTLLSTFRSLEKLYGSFYI